MFGGMADAVGVRGRGVVGREGIFGGEGAVGVVDRESEK